MQVRPEMLVCLDPGEPPAGLPKLTLIEQLCLAPIRPFRHMVVLKPTGAGNRTMPHDTLHRALVGHVIALPNPAPDQVASVFPMPLELLPDAIQVNRNAYTLSMLMFAAVLTKIWWC